MSPRSELEAQRILGHYKRLVLLGKALLPLAAGRSLVGPDCAYHLYFRHAGANGRLKPRRRTRAR
jgi:hypothetical protein